MLSISRNRQPGKGLARRRAGVIEVISITNGGCRQESLSSGLRHPVICSRDDIFHSDTSYSAFKAKELDNGTFLYGECNWRKERTARLNDRSILQTKVASLPEVHWRNQPSYTLFA
jgi:hypothetical protein